MEKFKPNIIDLIYLIGLPLAHNFNTERDKF